MDEFLEYFVNTYFEGQFEMELWNHFDTESPRTNNDIKGYNLKLKNHFSRAHPDIYKSIEPAPPRKKLNIGRDNEIKIYKKLFIEGNIGIDVYVSHLLPLFSFRKNKKKNQDPNVSDSSDDDEFENAIESDSEDEEEEL
ncbi:unnamed protein product [Brachionus calyciflorus]|uniref:Uncharacterized protein n=1 Tax=Brachionus calyciflorus TaxID=104777 RepID=A0A813MEL0_9BILA|nr:unnamed protein product [Brachionus calyciflorus]